MGESRTADAQAINQSTASHIPFRSISLAIVVTMVLYVGLATLADLDKFGAAVSGLPCLLWAQVVALSLLSYLLRFSRWHYFIFALGHNVPILRNLEIYLAAFALTLTPGKVGETIRSVYLHPYGLPYLESLGAFLSERLLDLVAVAAISSMVVWLFPEYRIWMFAAVASIAIVILMFRSRLLNFITTRSAKRAIVDRTAKLASVVRFFLSGCRVALALPLSLMAWLVQGVSLFLIAQALGYELAMSTVVSIYCLSILAGAASFIPGGLGATEAAIVLLLISADVAQSDAVTAAIISRGLTLWLAVGVGCLALTKLALVQTKIHPSA